MLLSMPAIAVLSENIILKNGTTYEGYVSNQSFGPNSKCTIAYSQFIKNIAVEDIVETGNSVKYNMNELSDGWKKWAESNNAFEREKDAQYLSLTRMTIKNQPTREYYILERGTKYIKCVSISEGEDECDISDIHCILKNDRDPNLLTYVDDVVKTESATYTGTIIEQYPGVQIKIRNNRDNEIHVVNYNEIKTIGKAPFNSSYNIWKQTQYLDKIITSNTQTEYGLIIENGLDGGYNLIFASKDDDGGMLTKQYSYKDIIRIEKIKNDTYNPEYDIILDDGESRINRDSTIVFVNIKEQLFNNMFKLFYLIPEADKIPLVYDKHVTIETSMADISDIYVCKERKIIAQNSSVKKRAWDKKGDNLITVSGFTYGDMMESTIKVSQRTSINGTTKIEFYVDEPGRYYVFLHGQNKCWAVDYK